MQRFDQYRPTACDHAGLGSDEHPDWLVVGVSRTRDSEELEESNFAATLKCIEEADPESVDHETHRFGHWGPGWFELIIVRPGSPAFIEAERIEAALSDYPVLDEQDYSEREYTAQCEALSDCIRSLTIEDDGSEVDSEQLAAAMFTDMWEHDQGALEGGGSITDSERDACLERLGYVLCDDDTWRPAGETEDVIPEGWSHIEGCDACGADKCTFRMLDGGQVERGCDPHVSVRNAGPHE